MSPEQAEAFSKYFIQGAEREAQTTKRIIAACPSSKAEFKLGDHGRPLGELVRHLVTSDLGFLEGIANLSFEGGFKPEAPATTAEMAEYYEKNFAAGLDKVKAMTPEQLATPVSFHGMFDFPAVVYLDFLIKHGVHHRAQVGMYLRAMNAHVPQTYGGSHDEPMSAPARA